MIDSEPMSLLRRDLQGHVRVAGLVQRAHQSHDTGIVLIRRRLHDDAGLTWQTYDRKMIDHGSLAGCRRRPDAKAIGDNVDMDFRRRSADSRFALGGSDKGLGGPVPWENIGGRAEFITFSVDGSATINPLTWFGSLRSGRAGISLHPEETR